MKQVDIRVIGRGHLGSKHSDVEVDMNALKDDARERAEQLFLAHAMLIDKKEQLWMTNRVEWIKDSTSLGGYFKGINSDEIAKVWDRVSEIEEELYLLINDKSSYRGINISKIYKSFSKGLHVAVNNKYVCLVAGTLFFHSAFQDSIHGDLFGTILHGYLAYVFLTDSLKIYYKERGCAQWK
jgi:hypothetical protein